MALIDELHAGYDFWHMNWELDVLWWINANWHGTWVDYIFLFITIICDSGIFWIILSIVFVFFKKWRKTGILMLALLLCVEFFNNLVLKNIANRSRPFYWDDYMLTTTENKAYDLYIYVKSMFTLNNGSGFLFGFGGIPDKQSFVSGHTMSSLGCATIIFLYHKKVGIGALVFASLVAFSRIYLCVHWPTDVLAGAFIGIGFGIGLYYLGNFLEPKIISFVRKVLNKQSQNVAK